eukprot:TRINITY_DN2101_c0_g1_i1.p1 TRINITY_DN2101_c0_g1~~TRINITY_DN2101_c0_g1_i1.p1  ORF type:complete len:514 (-),score=117.38 TRINITY_DN2101_c0_g1_i1:356-1897(-)
MLKEERSFSRSSQQKTTARGTSSSIDSESSDDGLFQEFCNGNFENLKNLSDKISADKRVELANLLVDISEATYKNRELMEWVFDQKINRSEKPMELFHSGEVPYSMEVLIRDGLRMRFGCVRWLSSLSNPTLQFLQENPSKTGDSTALRAAEDLLNRFLDSIYDIPIWLRQSCIHFKKSSVLKFGTSPPNPLLCGFLSSTLHGAMEGGGSKCKEQLGFIDKLVNAVGGFETDLKILNEETEKFVREKKNQVKKFEEDLSDASAIAQVEMIVSSSRPRIRSLDVFLHSKERRFLRIIQSVSENSSQISDGIDDSVEVELDKLVRKMDNTAWRYDKTWEYGVTSYIMKSEESQFFALKIQFRIKGKLVDIANFFSTKSSTPEYDPDITAATIKSVGDGINLLWGYSEMKWPISDRYFAFTIQEVIDVSKNQIVYIIKNAPYPGGGKKNAVFSKVFLCGYRFVQDPKDPEYVQGTVVAHADPGGLFPVWLVNKNARRQCAKFPRLVKLFLKKSQVS